MTVKLLRLSVPWNNYEEFHIHVRFPATWKKSSGMSSNNCSILMRWLQITVPLTRSPQDVPVWTSRRPRDGNKNNLNDLKLTSGPSWGPCLWLLFDTVHEFSQIRNCICDIFQWSLYQGSMDNTFLLYFHDHSPRIPLLHLNSIGRVNLNLIHSDF